MANNPNPSGSPGVVTSFPAISGILAILVVPRRATFVSHLLFVEPKASVRLVESESEKGVLIVRGAISEEYASNSDFHISVFRKRRE